MKNLKSNEKQESNLSFHEHNRGTGKEAVIEKSDEGILIAAVCT